MNISTEEITFASSNKINIIHAKIISDLEKKPKAIVQICHGMCEYTARYEEFANFLAQNGFVVCMHDQIGHGNSINSKENRGYFAPKDGYKFLIEDLKNMTDIIKKKYANIPVYLFGHSMGSFVSRCYVAKYGDLIDGLILCGTIGPNPLVNAGIKMAKLMAKAKGDHYRSKKLYNLALDFANIKFVPAKTRFDWVTSDEEEVKKHISDEKSDFLFTVSAFEDVFHLVNLCSSEMVISTIPKDLPILFISGELDPIGENGIGVRKAVKLYKKAGIEDVKLKIYENDRHALILEKNKAEVFNDILSWISDREQKVLV